MKTSIKALAIGLILAGAGPALAETPPATGTPIKMLEADVSSPGIGSFSGLGTATFNNQTGTNQSVNVGMSSNVAASTSVDSSQDYASVGAISAALSGGDFNQTFGVVSKVLDNATTGQGNTGTAVANDMITGNFVGSFTSNSDITVDVDETNTDVTTTTTTQNSTSTVDLAGVASMSGVDLSGSTISLDSGARDSTAAVTESGTGSASGNIASSTAATASVTSSSFSSGFMQTFSPATAVQAGVIMPAQGD